MSIHRRIARKIGKKQRVESEPLPPISATLFRFAKPMTSTMPTPRKLAHVRAAMALAQLAWNLPMLEKKGNPAFARAYREKVEVELATKPAAARELALQMMKTRLTIFANDHRLVKFVEVVEDGTDIRVLATSVETDSELTD